MQTEHDTDESRSSGQRLGSFREALRVSGVVIDEQIPDNLTFPDLADLATRHKWKIFDKTNFKQEFKIDMEAGYIVIVVTDRSTDPGTPSKAGALFITGAEMQLFPGSAELIMKVR